MIAQMTFLENGKQKTLPVEAADNQTIRMAVTQWAFNERRIKGLDIKVLSVTFDSP